VRVRVRERDEYASGELDELRRWLAQAFDEPPWRPEHWDDLGPGPHVVAESDEGELLAHACIAWVPITIGGTTVQTGYLEDVATRADLRGRGYGTAVVAAAAPLISASAEIGFLGTGSQPFYERLGWVRWRGSTAVREEDGSITPTHEEDAFIMALRFSHTPAWISVEQPIVRPRRDPDEAW
jgi:aminoglycoside 2'-N-acetyltransferase I